MQPGSPAVGAGDPKYVKDIGAGVADAQIHIHWLRVRRSAGMGQADAGNGDDGLHKQ